MRIEIVGVYEIPIVPSCHVIEMFIREHFGELDMGEITQELPGKAQSFWQVPWDERVLSLDGTEDLQGRFPRSIVVDGEARVAFFFHYLNFSLPLITPAGRVTLPAPTERPKRLLWLLYDPPD